MFKKRKAPFLKELEGKPACQNCKFGVLNDDVWQCRRYPPSAVRRGGGNAILTVGFEIPIVTAGYWCGEFKENDEG